MDVCTLYVKSDDQFWDIFNMIIKNLFFSLGVLNIYALAWQKVLKLKVV